MELSLKISYNTGANNGIPEYGVQYYTKYITGKHSMTEIADVSIFIN